MKTLQLFSSAVAWCVVALALIGPGSALATSICIVSNCWHLNGVVTYPGTRAEGLLLNVRMVNATFEDRNKPEFNADANTDAFLAQIPDYAAHGVRAFTLCLQGGMPGYEGALNSAFNPDGSLRESYLQRVRRVIEACDRQGMAVILGCYYQRQSRILQDADAVRKGVVNTVKWIQSSGFKNVVLEIANEYPHKGFAHPILKTPEGIAELVRLARQTAPGLLVSASGYGDGKLHDVVAEASDFLLIHFNGTPVSTIPARIAALKHFGKPIVCNEDDKVAEEAARAAEASVASGASWGLMLKNINQYAPFQFHGTADDPVVYATLKLIAFADANTIGAAEQLVALQSGKYRLTFSPTNGAILQTGETNVPQTIFRSGEQGLWQLRFRDGSTLNATAFGSGSAARRFDWQRNAAGDTLSLRYHAPEATVMVTVAAREAGFDFVGTVTPTEKTVLDFVLPGRLRFEPEQVRRFVAPLHPHLGVGAAFNGEFFRPQSGKFLKFDQTYPPVFADFLHLDASGGTASLYRIQQRTWQPWAGARDASAIFVPGRLAFGGDGQGGWCERTFGAFVKAGETWTTPVVRLAMGRSAEDDLLAYCQANAITRPLREKLPGELFEKFRRAVLVKYSGSAREKLAALDKLPVPALIHFTDFVKGGFDKEYPDLLPPNPKFGTPQELRELHDRAHSLGHLVMPYTNPTWWCDHPRGPTFERAGEAPLQLNLDGRPTHEKYSVNDGWTTTLWHPAVRAANRETVRQFTEDYPVDILFQDQCGARGWKYDVNPASPTPFAYAEGMLSMVDEDCLTKPLSTEDGWDCVVNAEVQLCGFTFALGPGRRPQWAREMKSVYPPGTWELYPLAQRVAHDKTAMLHHDLGKFVMDRPTLSWTLGLGFAMSYAVQAKALDEPDRREWLRWLDRIQKSICARYVGEPVAAFEHKQGSDVSGDDGIIRATYGPVRIAANLSPASRMESGRELAGYGFHAAAPGMAAGNLRQLAGTEFGGEGVSFVTEGDARQAEVWVYAAPEDDVAAEMPMGMSGELRLTVDGQTAMRTQVAGGAIRFKLPKAAASQTATGTKHLWHVEISAK